MEKIAEYPPYHDLPTKTVSLCAVSSIAALPDLIHPANRHFVLLLAVDASQLDDAAIHSAAEKLLDLGMIYLCAWGPGCERVHDRFDDLIFPRDAAMPERSVIITTWHDNEPLDEAVWFFLHCAWPTDDYVQTCSDWVAAAIGNPAWESEIRRKLLAEKEQNKSG